MLFVLDLSYSMNAHDIVWISRLDTAKKIIKQIVIDWGETDYGLIIFSQMANYFVPLTSDTWTFLDYVKDVNTGLLPGGGTDRDSLRRIFSGNKTDYSKIIFISDADIGNGIGSLDELFLWANIDPKKYFIGIGSEKGGSPRLPNGVVMKRANWDQIITSFDVENARLISDSLWAKLFHIESMDAFDQVIGEISSSFPSLSYSQIQILFVFLWVFILLLL